MGKNGVRLRIRPDNPIIFELFKKHLENGNSVSSFGKYMTGSDYSEFLKIAGESE